MEKLYVILLYIIINKGTKPRNNMRKRSVLREKIPLLGNKFKFDKIKIKSPIEEKYHYVKP